MEVTDFEDEDKNLLYRSNDGSNETVTVSNDKVDEFNSEVESINNAKAEVAAESGQY